MVYNNIKNTSANHTPFALNYSYYPHISFENDVHSYLKSCLANKLAKKLRALISICQQNLHYAKELQKQAYDKVVQPHNYTLVENV